MVTVTELVQMRNTFVNKAKVNVEIKWLKAKWDHILEHVKEEGISVPLAKQNWFAMFTTVKVPLEEEDVRQKKQKKWQTKRQKKSRKGRKGRKGPTHR